MPCQLKRRLRRVVDGCRRLPPSGVGGGGLRFGWAAQVGTHHSRAGYRLG